MIISQRFLCRSFHSDEAVLDVFFAYPRDHEVQIQMVIREAEFARGHRVAVGFDMDDVKKIAEFLSNYKTMNNLMLLPEGVDPKPESKDHILFCFDTMGEPYRSGVTFCVNTDNESDYFFLVDRDAKTLHSIFANTLS